MKKKSTPIMVLNITLYVFPIIFFIITYLFMTVSAEDVLQGAGTRGSILYALSWAFDYNARLSDMYAYAVINRFDYQFAFGIDTVFRLIDVIFAAGMIYLITFIIIGKRPRLRHGPIFAAAAMAVYLCPFCDSLYLGFSHIHNYLIIGTFSMLLMLPFALKLQGHTVPKGWGFSALMLVLGFLFGFSSNITPAAFLLALIIAMAYTVIRKKRFDIRTVLRPWEFTAVLGMLAAIAIMYGAGNGISHYTSGGYSELTDYIPLSSALIAPVWVLRHIAENLRAMAPCLVTLALALAAELALLRKGVYKDGGARFSAVCLLFVTAHTISMTQIYIRPLFRLIMPAYFVTLAGVGFTARRLLSLLPIKRFITALSLAVLLLTAAATVDIAVFRAEYNRAIAVVLESIRAAEGDTAEVPRAALEVPRSPVFGFTQFPLVQDWTLGQSIYGKKITLVD